MTGLLTIEGLSAGYEGENVIHDVSMEIDEGSVAALLGRNGAGKTTTLRTIMGLIEPTDGSVVLGGEDITRKRPDQIYRLGMSMVPEDRGIFPKLTVRENLEAPIISENRKGRTIDELIELFPSLADRLGSNGEQLSGGEQQMLAIARALRQNPRVLLLDEPSEGLAPQIVQDVAEVVQEIAEGGTTLVLVEQNSDLALDLASTVYLMESGRIVHHDDPEQIRNSEELLESHLGIGSVD